MTEKADKRYKSALRDLAIEASLLLLFGTLVMGALYYFADSGPIKAMRESLLSSHLVSQAYSDVVPLTSFHVRLVAFDENYCAYKSGGDVQGCQPKGPIDRGDLALFIERAAKASPKAIVLDVEPLDIQACDDQTRKLVRSMLIASRKVPIVLPRASHWNGEILRSGPTFFDQCSDEFSAAEMEEIERGEGIYFGHALLSSTHFLGVVDSVRPWIAADVPNAQHLAGFTRTGQTRVRIPQISLIAALALNSSSRKELLSTLQASGLETRWRTSIDPNISPSPLSHCGDRKGENCSLTVTSLDAPPAPTRLSFRFGDQIKMVETKSEEERRQVFSRLSFSRFNETAAEDLSRFPKLLLLAAATAQAYGDIHPSAAGPLSGGHILANAVFDFGDGKLISEISRPEAFWEDFRSLLLFVILTTLAAAVLTIVLLQLKPFRKKTAPQMVLWAWPVALLGMAFWETYSAWRKLHSDFSQGVFSYAVIGIVIGFVDLKSALEMSVKSSIGRGETPQSSGGGEDEKDRETTQQPDGATNTALERRPQSE